MKTFILIHITYPWVYRLYEEYIDSIHSIFKNLKWTILHNLFIPVEKFSMNHFHEQYNAWYKTYPESQFIFSGDISIFCQICNHLSFEKSRRNSFLNIEQMSHPSYYVYFRNIPEYIPIIDYSEENVDILQTHYSISYIPPFFPQQQIQWKDKTIDCLSIQNNAYRRKKIETIEEELRKYKSSTSIYKMDSCYGEERNALFRKTKIYINIHCSDEHRTLELIRIARLLSMGIIVLSQDTINSTQCYLSKYIYIVKPESMSLMIKEILENYSHYYEQLQKTWDEKEYFNWILENTASSFPCLTDAPTDPMYTPPLHDDTHSLVSHRMSENHE